MPIIPAAHRHLPAIHRLTDNAYTRLVQFGPEDLPDLIERSVCVVGVKAKDDPTQIWGFVAIQLEPRPETLPAHAPDRAYVRAILLGKRRSPSADAAALLSAGLDHLRSRETAATMVILQAQGHWLQAPLTRSGFNLIDGVRYYKFTQSVVPEAPSAARLALAGPAELSILAQLDAETFPPIWHMDEGALAGLLFNSRMQVAYLDGGAVGYAALTLNGAFDDPDTASPSAFLARLAVHPRAQGQGVGRQLLADSVAYAVGQGHSPIYLNTQVSNEQSQRLYEGMGFRSMNQVFQVYVTEIEAT